MRIPWFSQPPSHHSDSTELTQAEAPPAIHSPLISTLAPTTTLSCRQLFDMAFHCQSPAGQFVSIYRHSEIRSCALLWSDLRFCLRNNYTYAQWAGEDAAESETGVRFANREKEKYHGVGQKSSDDIWTERTIAEGLTAAWDKVPSLDP